MSKVALIGASGSVGAHILQELSVRGHTVTAIARTAERIASLPGVTAHSCDINETEKLIEFIKGHEAVISSAGFSVAEPDSQIQTVKTAGVPRYLVVGGAGSLEVFAGKMLVDQPDFPEAYRAESRKGVIFLEALKKEKELNWTFLSPSAEFSDSGRTGQFRLGKDNLLVNEKGSFISHEDFAVAMVDELENSKHPRQRFTVGY